LASLDPKKESERDFLLDLQNGDNQAWTALTSQFGPRLYNFLRHQVPGVDDAEELIGEVMEAAVRAIPNFDGRVALSTFLFSIARRKAADYWRQRRQSVTDLPETLATSGLNTDHMELEEILNNMRQEYRQVLLLRYYEGFAVDEIAKIIDRSYKATESLLSRARSQLREALRGSFDDEAGNPENED
jgi:RNA polymerase sigma-70 factor (ECF subfamily)